MEAQYSIAVVGAGGLGTPAAWGLVQHAEQKLSLRIIDGDSIELSNLNRQILFHESDLGRNKAVVLAERLNSLDEAMSLKPISQHVTRDNIDSLLGECDYILECSDSMETKFLVNDFCVRRVIPFCYAGVIGREGLLLDVDPGRTPCLRCVFGDLSAIDLASHSMSCRTAGIVGPIAGMFGFLQAQVVLARLLRQERDPATLLKFRSDDPNFSKAGVEFDSACSVRCSEAPQTLDLRAKSCPETFLYTKLALESLATQASLRVLFRSESIATNVHQSCSEEGYLVSAPERCGGNWRLLIEVQ